MLARVCFLAMAVTAFAQIAAAQMRVTIGVLNDASGVYADSGGTGSVVAARMAAEDHMAARRGLDVAVLAADHQNKADIAAAIARQWYDRDGVDAIFDLPPSSAALAVNQITRDKNKVFVASSAGTADLTGIHCTPNTVHWTYDTVALATGTGGALVKRGGDTWFFITADYTFGHVLQHDTTAVVERNGGRVLGSVRAPFPTADFSSFLLQAQASGAKVIGLANAGRDAAGAIRQAGEFGIRQGGQALAALLISLAEIHALGPAVARGLVLTEAFYWDLNDATRRFSDRFSARFGGRKPTAYQAGVYASALHYLRAVEAVGSPGDGAAVVARMKAMPTDDPLFGRGEIRPDGRKIHDMYLFEVKAPAEVTGPWDLYKVLAVIPAQAAFRPLDAGGCPLAGLSTARR